MAGWLSTRTSSDDLLEEHDTRLWVSAVAIGLAFAAFALLFSFVLASAFWPGIKWAVPMDSWMTVDGGRFIWNGALGYVYQGTGSYALPMSFIAMAPASGLIDHLHLVEGSPFPLARPSAWLVAGPYSLLFGIVLLHAVRRLAWSLGIRRRLWLVQVVACVLVLSPVYFWGHFEDGLALAFVLYGARLWLAGEPVRAAFLISVAVSFKQWALVLIPLLVFAAPAGRRFRTLIAAGALPGAFVALFLAVDWGDASRALLSPVNLVGHFQGHGSVYASWFGTKTSQVSRTLGLALSVPAGWALRRVRRPETLLAALALLVLIRPFSEAITYAYYWSPFLLLSGLVGVAVRRRFRWRDWAWQIGAFVWSAPRSHGGSDGWWWLGQIILISAVTVQMLRNCGVRFPADKPLLSVKNARPTPISKGMELLTAAGDASWTQ